MSDAPSAIDGIYVHVPFCSAVCPYCDFSVLTAREPRRLAFVDTLLAELALIDDVVGPFRSLYLGGGTPSILPAGALARIFEAIHDRFGATADAQISLEANPEDVTSEHLAAWRELGIDTLSLGVQSFDDESLRFLGRRHDGERARRAVETALAAGFRTVSVDLIFGLPGRDESVLAGDLARVVALGADHVSCYQLTIHRGTVFGRRAAAGELSEADEPTQAARFRVTHSVLAAAGYEAYEVSNFARQPRHRSRHNRAYWEHRPYLGLGPSAHSFVEPRRWWNERSTDAWERAVREGRRPVADGERLEPRQLALEALMLGLRTAEGVDLERIADRWGVDIRPGNAERIVALEREGLITVDRARLRPTSAGMAVADGLVRMLDV